MFFQSEFDEAQRRADSEELARRLQVGEVVMGNTKTKINKIQNTRPNV